MRFLFLLLICACGRRVWEAPNPTSRAAQLSARVDAVGATGAFSVKTPHGMWVYEVEASAEDSFSVGEMKMAYVSTLLLRLVDQRKAQLDDPARNYSAKVPDETLRSLLSSPENSEAVEELVRVLSGADWQDTLERELLTPERLLHTKAEGEVVQTTIADLISFGHSMGEGSLLTAPLQGERLAFHEGYGLGIALQDGLLGHTGQGCAVFHDPLSDVTIAVRTNADTRALVSALFGALR